MALSFPRRRGHPKPRHLAAKLHRMNVGRSMSPEQKRKLSDTMKRIGHYPPGRTLWTLAEDEIVRKFPPAVAAEKTGRKLRTVFDRRRALGLADGRRRKSRQAEP